MAEENALHEKLGELRGDVRGMRDAFDRFVADNKEQRTAAAQLDQRVTNIESRLAERDGVAGRLHNLRTAILGPVVGAIAGLVAGWSGSHIPFFGGR
jgi:hypothetical protein